MGVDKLKGLAKRQRDKMSKKQQKKKKTGKKNRNEDASRSWDEETEEDTDEDDSEDDDDSDEDDSEEEDDDDESDSDVSDSRVSQSEDLGGGRRSNRVRLRRKRSRCARGDPLTLCADRRHGQLGVGNGLQGTLRVNMVCSSSSCAHVHSAPQYVSAGRGHVVDRRDRLVKRAGDKVVERVVEVGADKVREGGSVYGSFGR